MCVWDLHAAVLRRRRVSIALEVGNMCYQRRPARGRFLFRRAFSERLRRTLYNGRILSHALDIPSL